MKMSAFLKTRPFLLYLVVAVLLIGIPHHLIDFIGYDMSAHMLWADAHYQEVMKGNYFPNWISDLYSGCGSSVFYFYPHVPYYITTALQFILPFDLESIFSILFILAAAGGAYFTYRWACLITQEKYSVLAGLFFVASVIVVYRSIASFAYTQNLILILLPLNLYMIERALKLGSDKLLWVVPSLSFIMLSTLPGTIITIPCLFAYALLRAYKEYQASFIQVALFMSITFALPFMLTAYYWLPVWDLRQYIYAGTDYIFRGHYNHAYQFEHISWNALFFGGYVLALLSASAMYLIKARNSLPSCDKNILAISYAITLTSLFLIFPPSKFLWDNLPLLKNIQFPARFFNIIPPFLALILAYGFLHIRNITERYCILGYMMLAVLMMIFFLASDENNNSRELVTQRQLNDYAFGALDYAPLTVPAILAENYDELPYMALCKDDIKIINGDGDIAYTEQYDGTIMLNVAAESPLTVELGHFYFIVWRAVTSEGQEIKLTPSEMGLMTFDLPEGEYDVRIYRVRQPSQEIGALVSLIGVGLWLLGALVLVWRSRSRQS